MGLSRGAAGGLAGGLVANGGGGGSSSAPTPVPVIYSNDSNTDVGNWTALRVAIGMERMGLVSILASIVNSTADNAPGITSAFLHYAGRDAIPQGNFQGTAATTNVSSESNWQPSLYSQFPHPVACAAPKSPAAAAVGSGGTFAAGTYRWVVISGNALGWTRSSAEVTATVVLNGSANLTWTADLNATKYRVFRSPAGGGAGSENVFFDVGNVTAWTDTGTAGTGGTPPVINTTLPEAVAVARQALASSSGGVVWLEGGALNVLSAVLQSSADGISGLTGMQLFTAKVTRVCIMGGRVASGLTAEWNLASDPTASNYVAANCPVPMWWTSFEAGNYLLTGVPAALTQSDPLAFAMTAAAATSRMSWDSLAMLTTAMSDPTQYGFLMEQGTNAVNSSTGVNTWTPGAGTHWQVHLGTDERFGGEELNRITAVSCAPATLPGAPTISPQKLSTPAPASASLIAHWDASVTFGATPDATAITSWADLTGNGYTLTAFNSPVVKTGILNSLPIVRLNGTNQYLMFNSAIQLVNSPFLYLFAVVVRRNAATSGQAAMVLVGEGQANDWDNPGSTMLGHQNTVGTDTIYRNVQFQTSIANPATNTAQLLTCALDGINDTITVNGVTAVGRDVSNGAIRIARIVAGARWQTSAINSWAQNDYGEMLLYTGGQLSGSQIATIQAGLKSKWGTP